MKQLHLEASAMADEIEELRQQLWPCQDAARGHDDGAGDARD